jgi:hypothetical protein
MALDTVAMLPRLRLHVYEHFLEHGVPPVVEQLMHDFSLSRADAIAALRGLAERRDVALVKGTARILMAWPFSAIATPFVVRAGARSYFANCSWDAIAFHTLLRAPIQIESRCHHCARVISIDMSDGGATRVEPASTIVYLALRPTQWWEDIITTCSNTMVFFCSTEHRDASDVSTSPDHAASLTPNQVHQLGVPLYDRRLELDFERPTRDALNAHFASLGLTGPYWQI